MSVFPLFAAVTQESAEETGVCMLHQLHLHTHTILSINMLRPHIRNVQSEVLNKYLNISGVKIFLTFITLIHQPKFMNDFTESPQHSTSYLWSMTGIIRFDIRTKKASLNSKEHGNCLCSWWTQSSHCRKTGQRSLTSSEFSPWPHRSANLWPKSNQSISTKTWKPCTKICTDHI